METSPEHASAVELSDRVIDGAKVARVMGTIAIAISLAFAAGIEHLLATANVEADGGIMLRALSTPSGEVSNPRRAIVLLVDGLRADEARALPSLRAWPGAKGSLRTELPSLSRPFYHLLLTGVPADASGVRTNRFDEHARHDSIADRVREAGGRFLLCAQGIDYLRTMFAEPGDRTLVAPDALGPGLDAMLAELARAPAPSLLLVHHTEVDQSAHDAGIASARHRAALREADSIIARLLSSRGDAALFVLSDHGHLAAGGHGGPEPEVTRAPLFVTAGAPLELEGSVPAPALAATIASWLGTSAPAAATRGPWAPIAGPGARVARVEGQRDALARAGAAAARRRLEGRRSFWTPLAVLFALMTLGPIKRAFRLDRGALAAIASWPLAIAALHMLTGRPFSLSAIDTRLAHGVRVALLGLGACLVAWAIGLWLARGERASRVRRVLASTAWAATAAGLASGLWVGFELGPWPLSSTQHYLPMYVFACAAVATLASGAGLWLASSSRLVNETAATERGA